MDADVNASSLPEAEDALVNVDPALVMREFRADVDATLDGMRVTVKSRAFPFAQNHANWETISLLIPDMQKSIAISGLFRGSLSTVVEKETKKWAWSDNLPLCIAINKTAETAKNLFYSSRIPLIITKTIHDSVFQEPQQ